MKADSPTGRGAVFMHDAVAARESTLSHLRFSNPQPSRPPGDIQSSQGHEERLDSRGAATSRHTVFRRGLVEPFCGQPDGTQEPVENTNQGGLHGTITGQGKKG